MSVHTRIEDVQAERDRLTSEIEFLEDERSTALHTFKPIKLPEDKSCMIEVWFGWNGRCYMRALDKETLETHADVEPLYTQGMSVASSHHYTSDVVVECSSLEPLQPELIDRVAQQVFDDAKHIRDLSRRLYAKELEKAFFDLQIDDWCELTGHVLRDDFFSED